MNLKQALESGKNFRRLGRPAGSYWFLDFFPADRSKYAVNTAVFTVEDVLATDWELEEKKIEVTASQLASAWADAMREVEIQNRAAGCFWHSGNLGLIFKTMLRQVGL